MKDDKEYTHLSGEQTIHEKIVSYIVRGPEAAIRCVCMCVNRTAEDPVRELLSRWESIVVSKRFELQSVSARSFE